MTLRSPNLFKIQFIRISVEEVELDTLETLENYDILSISRVLRVSIVGPEW